MFRSVVACILPKVTNIFAKGNDVMKIFRAIKTAVSSKKNAACCHNKDFYVFVPENRDFSAYTADSFGKKWSCVTRWVLETPEAGHEGEILVRPFLMTDIVSGPKRAELEHIFSHILYDRAPLGAYGTAKAIIEPFDRLRLGSLRLSTELPAETILRSSYILQNDSERVSLLVLTPKMIEDIMEKLYGNDIKER